MMVSRSSVGYLHLDFGHFESNIQGWNDVGGPAISSRFLES